MPAPATRIERVFALQKAHQWETKASTAEQRKEKLRKLKAAVEAHGDELLAAVKQDTRKPENEIRVTELLNVIGNIDRNIANLDEWMKPVEVSPSLNKNDSGKDRPRGARRLPHPGALEFSLRAGHGSAGGRHCRRELLHGQAHGPVPRHGARRRQDHQGSVRRRRKSPCSKAAWT